MDNRFRFFSARDSGGTFSSLGVGALYSLCVAHNREREKVGRKLSFPMAAALVDELEGTESVRATRVYKCCCTGL